MSDLSPKRLLSMPTGFGPGAGPRRRPDGGTFVDGHPTRLRHVMVSFLTDEERLRALLPAGLALEGEAVVTIDFTELTQIAWLAGRGYNVLGVRMAVTAADGPRTVRGQYLAVLWENLADAIVAGREQLGYPKIFADLPPPRVQDGGVHCAASWGGHPFFAMQVEATQEIGAEQLGPALARAMGDGVITHKRMPRTGAPWLEADADHLALTPFPSAASRALARPLPPPRAWVGTGTARFLTATWEQMPTQCHIVNALAALPMVEPRGAMILEHSDNTDLGDQRRLDPARLQGVPSAQGG